jgi:hypothetical protein
VKSPFEGTLGIYARIKMGKTDALLQFLDETYAGFTYKASDSMASDFI